MKAIETHTTAIAGIASRRGALFGAAALAMAASLGGVLPAGGEAVPSAEEAEFIRLCNRLVAIHQEEDAAFVAIADDDARDAVTAPLNKEWHRIEGRLYELEAWPPTRLGIAAAARAALAYAERELDGSIASDSLAVGLAWWIVEATEPEAARAEAARAEAMPEGAAI